MKIIPPITIMIIAKEKTTPYTIEHDEEELPLFIRIDIDQESDFAQFLSLKHKDLTPILFKNASHLSLSSWEQNQVDELVHQHILAAERLKRSGIKRLVIAADGDGSLQKLMSPRFSFIDFDQRIKALLDIYQKLKEASFDVGVVLTVEELSPFGMDATDGVNIAQKLENLGLSSIIATSGTKEFMPLYDRRITQKKRHQQEDFRSHEPSLASALWLVNTTQMAVFALGFIDDCEDAKTLAQAMGLKGLIEKASPMEP